MAQFLKHPITIASGVFGAVATLFNIPAIDLLFAFAWGNIGQWFSMAALMSTVGGVLPVSQETIGMIVAVTGVGYLAKQLLAAGTALENELDDTDS